MNNIYGIASVKSRMIAYVIDGALCLFIYNIIKIFLPFDSDDFGMIFIMLVFLFKDIFDGQSIGKRALGLRVRSVHDYNKTPSKLVLVLRNISTVLVLFIDVIVLLVNGRRQKLGDLITGCVVVYTVTETRRNTTVQQPEPPQNPQSQLADLNAGLDVDLSKWDSLNKDLQFNKPPEQKRHDHIKLGKRRKVDYDRDYIKENDWE